MNDHVNDDVNDTRPNEDIDLNRPARELFIGIAVGLILAALVGLPVTVWAFRRGRTRGIEQERTRKLSREEAIRTRPLVHHADRKREKAEPPASRRRDPVGTTSLTGRRGRGPKRAPAVKEAPAEADGPRGPRCFTTDQCVRIVWPMEIVEHDTRPGERMFRIRQGANIFARPGMGLVEFVFRAHRPVVVSVYVRVRYSDECGNSLVVSMDGGGGAFVGRTKVFGRWIWERAHRRFAAKPGLHRLTLFTREDGLEFDRVVLSTRGPGPKGPPAAYLDRAEPTSAPAFERLPTASDVLPEIGPVTAEAMPTDSLVAGRGHRNMLTVFTRLNDDRERDIRIKVRGVVTSRPPEPFRLTPGERTRLTEIEIARLMPEGYLRPARVEVYADGVRVHSQVVRFIRPLDWAFLGPFPDPEAKGIGLEVAPDRSRRDIGADLTPDRSRRDIGADLTPDRMAAGLHLLPEVSGREWIEVTDGSCYDELGVVDLNRVFGLKNALWSEKGAGCAPKVAYAVTCLFSHETRHACFAYSGDDCLRVWVNGRAMLSRHGNSPIETTRQVVGTKLKEGINVFVFKVPQTGYYWQILFEPDTTFPYSHPELFRPLPMKAWGRPAARKERAERLSPPRRQER